MSRLSNLLRQVEKQDPELAADLKREVDALPGGVRSVSTLSGTSPRRSNWQVARCAGATRSDSCLDGARNRLGPTAACGGLAGFGESPEGSASPI